MKFWHIFRRKPEPKPEQKMPAEIVGISQEDWIHIYNSIQLEYNAAHARQANPDAIPNQYMRGLAKALKILDTIKPYNLMEVL